MELRELLLQTELKTLLGPPPPILGGGVGGPEGRFEGTIGRRTGSPSVGRRPESIGQIGSVQENVFSLLGVKGFYWIGNS